MGVWFRQSRKCYLPLEPARCSIRFAEKVAEASPLFGKSALAMRLGNSPRSLASRLRSGEISPLEGITRGRDWRRWKNAVRLIQL
jgi:hypothetical protein